MCIILACEPGKRPSDDILSNCWHANPDGAGVMWAEGGRVEIVKGLMSFGDLAAAVRYAPKDSPLVVHMRIGTSGGYGPEVTHPYPVSSDLAQLHALDVECPVGIAHNGVLPYPTDDASGVSDTVYYVSHVVAPLSRRRGIRKRGGLCLAHAAKRELARTSKGSRLALMDGGGDVLLVGAGWQGVADGIRASNGSWRHAPAPTWYRYTSAWDDFDDFDDYDDLAFKMDEWGCYGCPCYDDCRKSGAPYCFDA